MSPVYIYIYIHTHIFVYIYIYIHKKVYIYIYSITNRPQKSTRIKGASWQPMDRAGPRGRLEGLLGTSSSKRGPWWIHPEISQPCPRISAARCCLPTEYPQHQPHLTQICGIPERDLHVYYIYIYI